MVFKSFNSAFFVAAVTAFLYASSTAYTYGYFGVLDLDGNVLDRNFHQIIYHGMILNILSFILAPLLFALLVTIHAAYKIEMSQFVSKKFSNARRLVNLKKKLRFATKKKSIMARKYSRRMCIWWSVASGVFLTFMALVIFERQGVNAAKVLLSDIEEGQFKSVRLKNDVDDSSLAYLFCGARNCAVYDIEIDQVVYFVQNEFSYLRENRM